MPINNTEYLLRVANITIKSIALALFHTLKPFQHFSHCNLCWVGCRCSLYLHTCAKNLSYLCICSVSASSYGVRIQRTQAGESNYLRLNPFSTSIFIRLILRRFLLAVLLVLPYPNPHRQKK